MPGSRSFGPLEAAEKEHIAVVMTIDEYEAIRLIDLEGLSQEQCAESMGVARTTVQAIYTCARQKLAQCLVNGLELSISGGDYILCEGDASGCGCVRCHKKRYRMGDEEK